MYEQGHKSYDKASKWLIQHYGDSLLHLAGVTGIVSWSAVQAELVQPRRLPDGLIEATFANGETRAYLLEVVTDYKAEVADQIAEEMLLVYLDRKRLPRAIMVVLDAAANNIREATTVTDPEGSCELRVRWQVLKLADLPAEDLFALGDVGIVPWIVLAKPSGPPAALVRRCGEVIDSHAPPTDRETLLVVTQVLLHLRYAYNSPDIFDLLREKAMLTEVPFIQELLDAQAKKFAEEAAAAAAKAAAEAAEAAERQSREDRCRFIAENLEVRFGSVPESLLARVRAIADLDRLARLHRSSVACSDLAEFEKHLAE